jgi:hypothetical protein
MATRESRETVATKNGLLVIALFQTLFVIAAATTTLVFKNYSVTYRWPNLSEATNVIPATVGLAVYSFNRDHTIGAVHTIVSGVVVLFTLLSLAWRATLILECFESESTTQTFGDCVVSVPASLLFLFYDVVFAVLLALQLFSQTKLTDEQRFNHFKEKAE